MFGNFLGNIALPHAMNSRTNDPHTSFNEWHEDTEIEPSVVTPLTTQDTSPTGYQYTQGLIYEGFGTLYMNIIRDQISAAAALNQPARQDHAPSSPPAPSTSTPEP
jgi:hypothetical protein